MKSGLAAWGVMYIDGHFLPYYGLYPISKGWHGVRQMPIISWAKYSDKWVNDLAEEQFHRVAQVTYEIRKAEAIPYLETTRTMSK